MNYGTERPGLRAIQLLAAWKSILAGSTPMLSIEVTRECPLRCPGCYAYGDAHLGGSVTLRSVSDYRGTRLVDGILQLVKQHRPLHLSLVGGEPLVRHRELTQLLPILSKMRVHTMIVTSAVIPIPKSWMEIPRVRVAVSVDGLPEHHNVRRHPATYDRVLANIAGCQVNIHGTMTHPMLERAGYLEEYVSFWSSRPEVVRIWVSSYTPQREEHSEEILTAADRERLVDELLCIQARYPKLLMNAGLGKSMLHPPSNPSNCMFSRMSVNYTADLKTRVEPCVFGGTPDCSRCGCAASTGLNWLTNIRLPVGVKIETLARGSLAIGALASRFHSRDQVAAQARQR